MAVYGYDYYGKSLYGAETAVQYSVEPVTATPIAPGHIQLGWGAATQNAWNTMRLVRNPFGVPAHGDDGTVIAEIPQTAPGRTWDDIDLPEGRVFYYGLFLGVTTWSSTTAYQSGDIVAYNGINYGAVAASTGITPGSNSSVWQPTTTSDPWIRAGAAAGLSVADHGYAMRLYKSIPRPYRLDTSEVTGYEDGVTNPDLFKFLSLFGHQLDTLATQTDILRDLRHIDTAPDDAVRSLTHQFGVLTEVSDEPIRRRVHATKAVELARNRGTDAGLADLINTLTGWDVEVEGSTNLMLNQDQANWASPNYPAWDKDVTYLGGEVVNHNGALWTATKSVSAITRADTMTVTASSGTVTKNPPASGGTGPTPYIYNTTPYMILSGPVNSYVTVSFTVAASGTYDLSIRAADGTAYGITTYSIDGVQSSLGKVDHYVPPLRTVPMTTSSTRYLGRYTMTAGTHTFTIKVVGKNAAATDYKAGLYSLSVTGTADPSRGQEPVNGSGWWTKVTAATGIDVTSSLTNPITRGPSTWSLRNMTTGSYPAGLSVAAGIAAVTGTDTNNSAGTVTNTGGAAANLGVRSVGTPTAPAWSSTTAYVLDNLVRDTKGTVWRALAASRGVTPGTDRDVWEVADIQSSDPLPLAAMVRQWGAPLNKTPQWSPQVEYAAGDRVAYNNFTYTAMTSSRNREPDGDAADNTYWQFDGPAQRMWTASAYTKLLAGTTSTTAKLFLDWYDAQGNLITTVTGATPSGFFQRFDEPTTTLSGDRSYSTDWLWDSSGAWSTSGTWVVSNGVLSPVTPSTTPYTRWALNTIPTGAAPNGDLRFYITFMTRPRLGAGAEQGMIFRSDNTAANFWMASRTRLTKNVNGAVTVMATWPEIPDGGRIYVHLAAGLIEVYRYVSPGVAPVKIASVAQATPDGGGFGLMERSL
ncbi:phage tail protein [Streptomyces sp. CB03238]|uniref:carbohydrate-binding protein n=1 Tax=Streptomyces sp. CB03238 TaxID=1907777 RepID=UPI000A1069B6|nr:phage tail protein [Streptomyces sp. CB03238]ORT58180.1 hypothetical protein BKD26_19960 [Streptomyces sp. CB03238]